MKTLSFCLLITLCWACAAPAQTGSAEDTNNIKALNKQFQTLCQAGSYQQAIPIAQQALELSEKSFGPEHPDSAQSLNRLALLCKNMGRCADAKAPLERGSGFGVRPSTSERYG